jgi:predicted transport protein
MLIWKKSSSTTRRDNMPLYKLDSGKTIQIKPGTFPLERHLQRLFEQNLEDLLGVRFIASEVTTGDRQRGRIDTLGIDQDGNPTIIEYKKSAKDNVINQGLFYLDWLVDHKGDFTLLAQKNLKKDVFIDWTNPRLILIAESFSEYDKYAINRMGANISLWVYRLYGKDLLYLDEMITTNTISEKKTSLERTRTQKQDGEELEVYTVESHLQGKPQSVVDLFESLRTRIFQLNTDETLTEKATKNYIAFRHGKNFCEVWVQASKLKIWIDMPPGEGKDPFHITRDVSKVGHWGTGDLEVTLEDETQLDQVMDVIEQAYRLTV